LENNVKYRHELKFSVTAAQYLLLRNRLKTVMKPDPHADSDGRYRIRSIYFDNLSDKALREKIDGVKYREKFRIRWYNDNFSYIVLEKKIKNKDLCLKLEAPLTLAQCRSILDGDIGWMMDSDQELIRELYCKMKGQGLRPRVLTSYMREPYVYKAGNVRITFDWDVRTSLYSAKLLDSPTDISAAEPGDMILEVKYDEYLPDIIKALLQTGFLRQTAFSKYAASRRFG
jgi:hypothetical protein